jgi:DNA-binding XRE family transcriptional regulator
MSAQPRRARRTYPTDWRGLRRLTPERIAFLRSLRGRPTLYGIAERFDVLLPAHELPASELPAPAPVTRAPRLDPCSPAGVRALRTSRGMSRSVFAAWVGVNYISVRRWEEGEAVPRGAVAILLRALSDGVEIGEPQP